MGLFFFVRVFIGVSFVVYVGVIWDNVGVEKIMVISVM